MHQYTLFFLLICDFQFVTGSLIPVCMTMHLILSNIILCLLLQLPTLLWCGIQSVFVMTAYHRPSCCAKVTRQNVKYVPRQILEELP